MFSCKAFYKKEKENDMEPNGAKQSPKTFMSFRKQRKPRKGGKPRGKPKRDQTSDFRG